VIEVWRLLLRATH